MISQTICLIFSSLRGFLFQDIKRKKYKRDYSNYNEEAFINEFSSIDWSDLFHGLSDTTEMFDKFYTKVNNVINSHLPLKPLTRKESKFQTKPWIITYPVLLLKNVAYPWQTLPKNLSQIL